MDPLPADVMDSSTLMSLYLPMLRPARGWTSSLRIHKRMIPPISATKADSLLGNSISCQIRNFNPPIRLLPLASTTRFPFTALLSRLWRTFLCRDLDGTSFQRRWQGVYPRSGRRSRQLFRWI